MAFSMKLWQVQGPDLKQIGAASLDDEERLETWVVKDPGILGIDVLLIGRQVTTQFGGRIDLLAVDDEANLIVLELKRDKTPREIVAQALDYASSVNGLSYEQIDALTKEFTGKALSQAFNDHYGFPLPQTVNASHSIIILASSLDDSSERIVEYLSEEYGVPINVLFFTFFSAATAEFLGRAWLKDPEELQDLAQARKRAPWSGYYFVNIGEGPDRSWDDCVTYGFVGANGGEKYSNPLKKLKPGDLIFAYLKELGYAGFGRVTRPAMMVRDFVPDGQEKTLLGLPLKQPNIAQDKDNTALCEWVVGVKWQKTFTRDQAKKFPGIFANQHIVCKLSNPRTVEFLRGQFGISE